MISMTNKQMKIIIELLKEILTETKKSDDERNWEIRSDQMMRAYDMFLAEGFTETEARHKAVRIPIRNTN